LEPREQCQNDGNPATPYHLSVASG
jgi:hypothetical protein